PSPAPRWRKSRGRQSGFSPVHGRGGPPEEPAPDLIRGWWRGRQPTSRSMGSPILDQQPPVPPLLAQTPPHLLPEKSRRGWRAATVAARVAVPAGCRDVFGRIASAGRAGNKMLRRAAQWTRRGGRQHRLPTIAAAAALAAGGGVAQSRNL